MIQNSTFTKYIKGFKIKKKSKVKICLFSPLFISLKKLTARNHLESGISSWISASEQIQHSGHDSQYQESSWQSINNSGPCWKKAVEKLVRILSCQIVSTKGSFFIFWQVVQTTAENSICSHFCQDKTKINKMGKFLWIGLIM